MLILLDVIKNCPAFALKKKKKRPLHGTLHGQEKGLESGTNTSGAGGGIIINNKTN